MLDDLPLKLWKTRSGRKALQAVAVIFEQYPVEAIYKVQH